MRAYTKCPGCGEIVEEDCSGCIRGGNLLHKCNGKNEPELFEVKWRIIEGDEMEDLEE